MADEQESEISVVLQKFKPTSILDYWTVLAYLLAVGTLISLRGLDLDTLFFFLFPPTFAYIHKNLSDRYSTRLMSALFLSLVGAGVTLASKNHLFPNLGGVDKGLSAEHNRILAWYAAVYLLYVFNVLPVVLFGRGLIDHVRRKPTQFSVFTCVLGLIAALFVGPLMFWVTQEHLGLFPIWAP